VIRCRLHQSWALGGANFATSDAVELAGGIEKYRAEQEVAKRFLSGTMGERGSEVEDSQERIAEMHAVPKASLQRSVIEAFRLVPFLFV
jgi:hypothetical protein